MAARGSEYEEQRRVFFPRYQTMPGAGEVWPDHGARDKALDDSAALPEAVSGPAESETVDSPRGEPARR